MLFSVLMAVGAAAQSLEITSLTPSVELGPGDEVQFSVAARATGMPDRAEFVSATLALRNPAGQLTADLGTVRTASGFAVNFEPGGRYEITGPAALEVVFNYRVPLPNSTNFENRRIAITRDLNVRPAPVIESLSSTALPLNTWSPVVMSTSGLEAGSADSVQVTFRNAAGKSLEVYYHESESLSEVLRQGAQGTAFGRVRVSGDVLFFGLVTAVRLPAEQGGAEEEQYKGLYDVEVRTQFSRLPAGVLRRQRVARLAGGFRVGPANLGDELDVAAVQYTILDGPNAGLTGVWGSEGANVLNAAPGSRVRLRFRGRMRFSQYWFNRFGVGLIWQGDVASSYSNQYASGTNGQWAPIEDRTVAGEWRAVEVETRLPETAAAPLDIALLATIDQSAMPLPNLRSNLIRVHTWAPPRDIAVDNIEVVQVVQNPQNTIPLIAGKRTVARVFAVAKGADPVPQAGVECVLEGYRDGVKLEGTPRVISPVYPASVPGGSARRDLTGESINFELPLEWTAAGPLELRAELTLTGGLADPEPGNNRFTLPAVTFVPSVFPNPFRVLWYRACVQTDAAMAGCPEGDRWAAALDPENIVERLFPVPAGSVEHRQVSSKVRVRRTPLGAGFDEFDYMLKLRAQALALAPDAGAAQFTALFADSVRVPFSGEDSRVIAGLAPVGSPVNWLGGAFDATTQAHEVGHSAGLQHPNTADSGGAAGPDGYWQQEPDKTSAAIQEVGFDVTKGEVVAPSQFDLMAYRAPRWISPFHYRRLMETTTYENPEALLTNGKDPERRMDAPVDAMILSGWVSADGMTGGLEPAFRMMSAGGVMRTRPGAPFCLDFYGGDTRLGQHCFEPAVADSDGRPLERRAFSRVAAVPSGVNRVELTGPAGVLAGLRAGGEAPGVRIDQPAAGESWRGSRRLAWVVSGAGDGPVQQAIHVSGDGGATWRAVDVVSAPLVGGAGAMNLHSADLPAGDDVRLRVLVTTGWSTASAVSEPIRVLATARGEAAPLRLDFGTVAPAAHADRTVTVMSTGNTPLSIVRVRTEGIAFRVVGAVPGDVAPGRSGVLRVRFQPHAGGPHEGALIVETDDVDRPVIRVPLAGSATGDAPPAPAISVTPEGLDFGDVTVGATRQLVFTVTNQGQRPLEVIAMDLSPAALTLVSAGAPFTLAPGAARDIAIRFAPTAAGDLAGGVAIRSNDPSRGALTVPVRGRATAPPAGEGRAEISPLRLEFGSLATGASRELTVTIRSTGPGPLTVSSLQFSNTAYSTTVTAPLTIAAGGQLAVPVRFLPPLPVLAEGVLVIATNDPRGPVAVTLTGTGLSQPAPGRLQAEPPSVDFGTVPVGELKTLTLTLRNLGPGPAIVTDLTTTGAMFSVLRPVLPVTLALQSTMTLTVRMLASVTGPQIGSLAVRTDGGTLNVGLTGTGLVPKVLSVDDGRFETFHRQTTADAFYMNRLTPASYPATLRAIRVFVGLDTIPPGGQITVVWAGHGSGAAEIPPISIRSQSGRVAIQDQWVEYVVPPTTITSGDFLVGFASTLQGERTVALDTTAPNDRSYFSSDGVNFQLSTNVLGLGRGNFGIRAVLE